MAKKKIDFT